MEVTISLGIISVAVLSLFGLLSQAMTGAHQAAGRTIGSEIGSRLIGELQLKDWPTLIAEIPTFRYFDEFGEEIITGDASNESAFTARSSVEADAPTLSTSATASSNPHCRKIMIIVSDSYGTNGQASIEKYLIDLESTQNLHFYQSAVVNMDK
jgi:uncharacterized protein (TIGR02598 family)